MSTRAWSRTIVGQLLLRVLVEPVRTGRLRASGWPPGLAPVVGIGLAVYAIGLIGAVTAGALRTRLPHDSIAGFPPALLPFMIIMITVVVALVCTGALHAPWPLRAVGLLVPLVVLVEVSAWTLTPWSVLVQLGCWSALLVFAAIRRQHAFAWWEYVVVQTVVGLGVVLAVWLGIRPGLDRAYLDVTDIALLLLASLALFAIPTAVTAGVAVSEVALGTAVWVVETVSARVRPRITAGLTVGLLVVATALVAWSWWRSALPMVPHLIATATAAGVLLGTFVVGWGIDQWAVRRRLGGTRLHQVVPQTRRINTAFAVVITLPVVLAATVLVFQLGLRVPAQTLGLSVLPDGVIGVPEVSDAVLRGVGSLLAGVLAGPVAVVLAVRRAHGRAELVAVVGVLSLVRGVDQVGWWAAAPSSDDLSAVAMLAVVIMTLTWLVIGRLSPRRIEAVAVAALIAFAVSQRELLADPLGLVLGGTAGVLLGFGLVWSLLTGAEEANADSPRFPRPARTLLVVANLAVVMTVFAFGQLTVQSTLSLDGFVREGAEVIGTGLLVAGLWALIRAAVRDEEVIERSFASAWTHAPQRGDVPGVAAAATSEHGQSRERGA